MVRRKVGWKMRPKLVFLFVLALGVVGSTVTGVAATAEDVTDAVSDAITDAVSTPPQVEDELKEDVTSTNVQGDKKNKGVQKFSAIDEESPPESALASEVSDMMRDPYRPNKEDAEDDKEKTVDSDTVVVVDSHVIKANKTHDSDSMMPNLEENVSVDDSVMSSPSTPVSESAVSQDPQGPEIPLSSTSEATSDDISTTGETTLTTTVNSEDEIPGKSTGLSSISIISVSRVAMSPPTEVAAILSMLLVVSAVAGYLGMLAWRKILEKRYGNREMLVNEDDDLRHFEL